MVRQVGPPVECEAKMSCEMSRGSQPVERRVLLRACPGGPDGWEKDGAVLGEGINEKVYQHFIAGGG